MCEELDGHHFPVPMAAVYETERKVPTRVKIVVTILHGRSMDTSPVVLDSELTRLVYRQVRSSTDVTPSAIHKKRTAEVAICIILEKTARSPSTVTARLNLETRWRRWRGAREAQVVKHEAGLIPSMSSQIFAFTASAHAMKSPKAVILTYTPLTYIH